MSTPVAPARPHTRWSRIPLIALAATAVLAVFVIAFSWPSVTSTVHDVPIVVAGSGTTADTVATQLEGAGTDAASAADTDSTFTVTRADDRDAAVRAIQTRDAFGAVVVSEGSAPEVLTASAEGVVVSQIMSGVATQLQTALDAQLTAAGVPASALPVVTVTDVVPLASTDARGAGLTAISFPLVIGGMIGGVLVSLLVAGVWRRLVAVVLYGVGAGIAVVAIAQPWFGILQGSPVLNGLAVTLGVLSISAFIVGMTSLIGPRGIAVGAVLAMLVGNPISGAAQPTQFLPGAWGEIGQFLPPGAGATLMRDLSYFPDASMLQSWLVLAGWVALGIVLMVAGHFRSQAVLPRADALEEPLPAGAAPAAA